MRMHVLGLPPRTMLYAIILNYLGNNLNPPISVNNGTKLLVCRFGILFLS
jgi:hypothetical protein